MLDCEARPRRAVAPGKVILLGEHAVVYGRTALAGAIDRSVEVSIAPASGPAQLITVGSGETAGEGSPAVPLRALARAAELIGIDSSGFVVTVTSDLPAGVGLGSSAALSVALIRALAAFTGYVRDDAAVCAQAFEIEKIFHGFPSGIDNTVATFGGLITFKRVAEFRHVAPTRQIPLVVALGRTLRETQRTVRALRQHWEATPHHYEALFDEIEDLVHAAHQAVAAADLCLLGTLMDANQALLRCLGVSTDELDHLVTIARAAGAFGAKLTGGGGGGAVICVGDTARLLAAFAKAGYPAFMTTVGQRGSYAADDEPRVDPNDARAYAAAR
jgi:hydroxymethylglutaryl-CoA reductase